MGLFKSKYQSRIEKKIIELQMQRASLKTSLDDTNQIRSTGEYCKLSIKIRDIENDIELLNEIINPCQSIIKR